MCMGLASDYNDKEKQRIDKFLDFMKKENGTPIVNVDFMDWLIKNGFFKAPASTKYHGNHEGGLFEHSMAVADLLVNFTKDLKLTWQREESPYVIGMFHDLCKIDSYITEDGVRFEYNQNQILTGHAEKSIMLLSQFINLTEEELLSIRFHMGAYVTDDWDSYDKAIHKYDGVLWTHTADMYASKVLNT